ncbi:MAG: DUF1015 domain-containing protein [Actinobacteria bacterium]|nr:DUF1015 domain-containing protein [Actinomycetota bacterium]MCL5882649.1 DUF1015 domain-containing protein [Actinomycetota bacterium]
MIKLADVVPFRGLRYNREAVSDLSQAISPPYDIISPSEQRRYHEKNPFNAIHLDFGMEKPADSESDNRYTRAAGLLRKWLSDRVLLPEDSPAFYLCREEFRLGDGSTASREGFIALIRLADFSEGVVLPHEETASGPKADRLRLMQATEANLSAIYCLYSDPEHTVIGELREGAGAKPEVQLKDEAGTVHSLWVVDDPEHTAAVNSFLADKTLLIADGHHRYETALAYRDERRAREEGAGGGAEDSPNGRPYDFLMVYLTDMDSTGPAILPIHRFVSGLSEGAAENLPAALSEKFDVTEIERGAAAEIAKAEDAGGSRQRRLLAAMAAAGPGRNTFGMYLPATGGYYLLTGREPRPMFEDTADGSSQGGKSAAYRSLDVAVLDRVILDEVMGIRPGGANESARVRFVERTEKAFEEITKPGFDAAFFLNPTSMQEIKEVAEAGEKMPQKSTYFYPKPVTGLVFRSFSY